MAINWTQVNVPTILAVGAAAVGIFNYIGDFDKRLAESENYRVMRSQQTDSNFVAVNKLIAESRAENQATRIAVNDLPFRVGNLEKGQEEQGKRIDRLSELIITNLEGVRKDIGALGTKIEVLSSKMDDNFPRDRAELNLNMTPVPRRN